MKSIPLTKGKIALVSDQDHWLVKQFSWYADQKHNMWYAQSSYVYNGKSIKIYMHRLLAGFPPFWLDHKNHNGLDNRRGNLRPATRSENQANSRRRIKGFIRSGNKWRAVIQVNKKHINLGCFSTTKAAHAAYLRATKQYFGEFARV